MAGLEVLEPGAGTGTTLSVVRLQQSPWLWTQGVDSPGRKQGYGTQTAWASVLPGSGEQVVVKGVWSVGGRTS